MPDSLIEGEWYWVRNDIGKPGGGDDNDPWWPAKRISNSAGGWTNEDTWEDWDRKVVDWIHISRPPGRDR